MGSCRPSAPNHAWPNRAARLQACRIGGCCGKDTPLLPAEVVAARMGALPRWALAADRTAISRSFTAKNWWERPRTVSHTHIHTPCTPRHGESENWWEMGEPPTGIRTLINTPSTPRHGEPPDCDGA